MKLLKAEWYNIHTILMKETENYFFIMVVNISIFLKRNSISKYKIENTLIGSHSLLKLNHRRAVSF